jgi:hypothetical protein
MHRRDLQTSAKFLDNSFKENMQKVQAENKIGQTGATLKMSPTNFSAQITQQLNICIMTIKYNKTIYLHTYNTTVVHKYHIIKQN